MKIIDHIKNPQYNYKQNVLSNDKLEKEMLEFLNQYRLEGEELTAELWYDGYVHCGVQTISSKRYEIYFKDIQTFTKKYGAEMRGSMTVYIGPQHVGIYLDTPSLNILSNYPNYIDQWISEVRKGNPKPVWGSNSVYWFNCQSFKKDVMTSPTAIKWFSKYMDMAQDMIKKGIIWSNSKEIQDEYDYSSKIQNHIYDLNEQIGKLSTEKVQQEKLFEQYRQRIMENFKKEREMMKDF